MNTSLNNYNSPVNRNLSSLLSQIQDEGPAFADAMKQNSPDNIASNIPPKAETAAAQPQQAQQQTSTLRVSRKEISPGIWLQLLLLLISAALLVSTMFRLDAQTDDIEKSLSDYEEQIEETISLQNEKVPARTRKINKKLKLLQNDMQLIKTDYSELDKKYASINTEKTAADIQPQAEKQEDISAYQTEIQSLKSELQNIKAKLGELKQAKAAANITVSNSISNGLTVSLASFSSKYNADKIVKRLSIEGLQPIMTQAVVNGERVYRLSVGGFSDRNEAELFIRKAGEQYGMFGSRIKES